MCVCFVRANACLFVVESKCVLCAFVLVCSVCLSVSVSVSVSVCSEREHPCENACACHACACLRARECTCVCGSVWVYRDNLGRWG